MNIYAEDDFEDEETAHVQAKAGRGSIDRRKPTRKASYESNADVQGWLQEQAVEGGGIKPEFNPTFLASLRDAPWILSSLTQFYEADLSTDVLHVVMCGHVATV